MTQARYGVLLCHDADDSLAARRTHEALAALVRDLNRHTRFVSLTLNSAGNVGGAANVLAWRTGYATALDFSRGYPRSEPDEFSAEKLLAAGEVDAALVVCDDPLSRFSGAAGERFRAIPTVAIDWRETATMAAARVAIPVALIGVESGGTVFRADGVPLALRPVLTSELPADQEVLRLLKSTIKNRRRQQVRIS
jgi:formylmethanofuran dehydrogenase subunit B